MIPMFQYPIFLDFIIPKSYQYIFVGNYDYDEYFFKPPNSIIDYIFISYNNIFAFSIILFIRVIALVLHVFNSHVNNKKLLK